MFPTLPQDVQKIFPQIEDTLLGEGPNIRIGHLSEFGTNPVFPLISVFSEGSLEPLTRGRFRHIIASVDYWTGAAQTGNVDGRRIIAILYQYSNSALQDANFSGGGIAVQRCFETRASDVMFEPATKLYHIANAYQVEAVAKVWY